MMFHYVFVAFSSRLWLVGDLIPQVSALGGLDAAELWCVPWLVDDEFWDTAMWGPRTIAKLLEATWFTRFFFLRDAAWWFQT